MRRDSCILLDQLAIKFEETTYGNGAEIVLSKLYLMCLMSTPEMQMINSKILSSDKFKTMFDFLKAKDETEVFDALEQICEEMDWPDLGLQTVQGAVQSSDSSSSTAVLSDETYPWIITVRENLSAYLQHDAHYVIKYWDKCGAPKSDLWKNVYNFNIEIKDIAGKKITNIDSFDRLFERREFKRIDIIAPAGYGKSTFVHEMVTQWVSGSNWASKFKLVFLLRLGEIKKENFCLKDLFERCLNTTDTITMMNAVEDRNLFKQILFVFDGFDEMNENLVSSQFLKLILGNSRLQPFVVLTATPECIKTSTGSDNLCVHLNGFNEKGIDEQMLRFGLQDNVGMVDRDVLKVPLFCRYIEILQKKTDFHNVNLCQLINNTVQYLLERYNQDHPEFSESDKTRLFCMLGRVALAKQAEYKKGNACKCVETINDNFLRVAINADLIMSNSSDKNIYFPHLMFAKYFAAFYLFITANLKVEDVDSDDSILFKEYDTCEITSLLVCFLSYFDNQFKADVWNILPAVKPILKLPRFNEFESLPPINVAAVSIWFPPELPARLASSISSKLTVPSTMELWYASLENGFSFRNMSIITDVTFDGCTLNVASVDLLHTFSNVSSMKFRGCNICCRNEDAKENKATQLQNVSLKEVKILSCNGDQGVFFSTFLKLCKVIETVVIDSGLEFLKQANFINFNSNAKLNFKLQRRSDPVQSFIDYNSLQNFILDYTGPDNSFTLTATVIL